MPHRVILDDRLLIEDILVGLPGDEQRHTTSLWYYRACRAAVAGAGGHLSGPFVGLDELHQRAAVRALLVLPAAIGLPDPRVTVPLMAEVSERHPRLNVLNVEAVAAAIALDASVWLSVPASRGILPAILDADDIPWRVVDIG